MGCAMPSPTGGYWHLTPHMHILPTPPSFPASRANAAEWSRSMLMSPCSLASQANVADQYKEERMTHLACGCKSLVSATNRPSIPSPRSQSDIPQCKLLL
ncbi:uncharacterized protein BT62DRAFT_82791 [Guyanagaster necrorhizus]|uniref:Uncharacterized protein n=1 Tax=Guyanagaster necrorhizus TaxID=856835 RepID=A0A9P7VSP0_9AGAR|nr:uncharacterized protein BT62DRAFT_82791 [Guyanagaster necrorhizus MCA 3950]KAG7446713.1 hypothetical protein BT62DRAFT_82791 [Guyanagaster necrorhizus MCA 3950]